MQKPEFNRESGKSIMEMLIVLAIAAVLVTVAIAQLGNSTENLDRQNIAREFKVALERARFDSVKRRPEACEDMSRVVITSATRFELITDLNQNGTLEPASETRTTTFGTRGNVNIVGEDIAFPTTIRFDRRGNATSGDCGALVDVVQEAIFCNTPCTAASANSDNSNIVFVSRTGTAAMLPGGTTLPDFDDPDVTEIEATTQVNPLVAVWDPVEGEPSPSPSPSGTPIPTPTPTPTPIPTPSPTGTPAGTPTPTPTPVACLRNESPDETGCVCMSPMWVRNNGQCK